MFIWCNRLADWKDLLKTPWTFVLWSNAIGFPFFAEKIDPIYFAVKSPSIFQEHNFIRSLSILMVVLFVAPFFKINSAEGAFRIIITSLNLIWVESVQETDQRRNGATLQNYSLVLQN